MIEIFKNIADSFLFDRQKTTYGISIVMISGVPVAIDEKYIKKEILRREKQNETIKKRNAGIRTI